MHPENTLVEIKSTDSGIITVLIDALLAKASNMIPVTGKPFASDGIFTVSSFPRYDTTV